MKNPVRWSRVSKKATVLTSPLEELHVFEGCAVDPGGDAIPVVANTYMAKVCARHDEVSIEKAGI